MYVCKRRLLEMFQEHANKSTECVEEFTKQLKEETEATEQLSPTSGIVRRAVRASGIYININACLVN